MAWKMVLTYLHLLDPGIPIDFMGFTMGFTRPGKRLHNYANKITMLFMGKSSISMAIFNQLC